MSIWRMGRALAVLLAMVLLAGEAKAAAIACHLDMEFSGATEPVGPPPWLTATIDDGGTLGSVTLTLDTSGLSNSEFVSDWSFNIDTDSQVSELIFSSVTKTGSFSDPVINLLKDGYRADGDGYYDIKIVFGTAEADRFGVGDVAVFTITGISSLHAYSFDALSLPSGKKEPYLSAAHVQSIGNESGWITSTGEVVVVPEPITLAFLGLGGMVMARRRAK